MTDRILYLHRTRGRSVEGVHIRSVAGALRELGFVVDILSPPGVDPEASEPVAGKSKQGVLGRVPGAVATGAPEWLFELVELLYNVMSVWRLAGYLRRHQNVWIYERYSLFLWTTVWLARRRGIPVVLEVNDSAVMPRVRPLLMQRLARRIERWVFNHCDGLVFVSTAFRDQVLAAHGSLAATIISPNAADSRRFDPAQHDRSAIRSRLGIEGKLVCGYLGAFAEWHGIHKFIDEMAPQLAAHPNLLLLLVGDGKTRPRVEQALDRHGVRHQAVLTGNVAHHQVAELIAAMDISVLPDSNTYGSPMKLFELMSMGVPVVAPDYGPVAEVIKDGRTGWLFPQGDMQRCLEVMLSLGANDIHAVGRAAREYIIGERQWTNNAAQLVELYRVIVAPRQEKLA
ncbi:MAG: glycosyltransferase family 4 protein [Alcanivoracaceae bacterium]